MITEWFMSIFYYIAGLFLSPISFVFEPLGSMAGLIELMSLASIFMPMTVFGLCLSTWLGIQGLRFAVVILNWILGKIPTIS